MIIYRCIAYFYSKWLWKCCKLSVIYQAYIYRTLQLTHSWTHTNVSVNQFDFWGSFKYIGPCSWYQSCIVWLISKIYMYSMLMVQKTRTKVRIDMTMNAFEIIRTNKPINKMPFSQLRCNFRHCLCLNMKLKSLNFNFFKAWVLYKYLISVNQGMFNINLLGFLFAAFLQMNKTYCSFWKRT